MSYTHFIDSIQVYPSGDWDIKHTFPTGCIFSRRTLSGKLTFGNRTFNGQSDDYTYIMGIVDCKRPTYEIKCNGVTWWEGYINHKIGYSIDEDNCTITTTPLLSDEYDCFVIYGFKDVIHFAGFTSPIFITILDEPVTLPYTVLGTSIGQTLYATVNFIINNVINADVECGFVGDIVSSFFWRDDYPDATPNAVNYITGAVEFEEIGVARIHEVRDTLGGTVDDNYQYISFNEIMAWLKVFNVYWYIDINGDFRLEHLHYFERSFADRNHTLLPDDINITTILDKYTGKPIGYGKNKYDYLEDELPSEEIVSFMDAVTEDFVGLPIYYDVECTYNYPIQKIKKYTFPEVLTDLPMLVADPDSVTSDGWVLMAMKYQNLFEDNAIITGWPTDVGYDTFTYTGAAITSAIQGIAIDCYAHTNTIGNVSLGEIYYVLITGYVNNGGEDPTLSIANVGVVDISNTIVITGDGLYIFTITAAGPVAGYLLVYNTLPCDWEFTDCVIDPENFQWLVQWELGALSGDTQNNGHMSIANLMDNYWRHDRILADGTMNGNAEGFSSVRQNRHQVSVVIPKCCDLMHWNTYIQSDLGYGKIHALTEGSDTYEVELLYGSNSGYKFSEALMPALVRNEEGDNLVASGTTTLMEITDITGSVITLTTLPSGMIDTSIDWFVQSDTFSAGEPGYTGDYTVQDKVTEFDFINNTITVASTTGFNVGDNICLYSPWANYQFRPGQTDSGIISSSGAGWRSLYVSPGPAWYDETLERYVVLVNGRGATHLQVGFAYSTDLVIWTIGNGDAPIITNADHVDFTTHAIAEGNVIDVGGGRIAFCVTGFNGTNRYCHIVQMDKDCTNISISNSLLTGATWYTNGLARYKNKYVIVTMKSNGGALETWTVEMWSSTTLTSGYTKTCDVYTTEYDANDSVWLEGHSDSLSPFVENGKLYCLTAGTQRYTISFIQGNRTAGLMVYDGATTWSIVNDFAPELIFPMYFYNIASEDYGWAGGHMGGKLSFVKRNGKCYFFCSFLYTADTYQIACLEMTNRT